MTERTMRLAIGQSPGELSGAEARLGWLEGVLGQARGDGVEMLVLPELFLAGYNIGDGIGKTAEPADGRSAQRIAALTAASGIAINYGFAEREGDTVYSAAQCITPAGERLGGHRKLAIPPGFERNHLTAGRGVKTFTYGGVTFTNLICYDIEFVEAARHAAAAGAQVILSPTALSSNWNWVARTLIPARAYENGVFLAYANHAGTEHGLEFLGHSLIAAPDGIELARAGDEPGLITADLDIVRVAAAQARLPYLTDRKALVLD